MRIRIVEANGNEVVMDVLLTVEGEKNMRHAHDILRRAVVEIAELDEDPQAKEGA